VTFQLTIEYKIPSEPPLVEERFDSVESAYARLVEAIFYNETDVTGGYWPTMELIGRAEDVREWSVTFKTDDAIPMETFTELWASIRAL